MNNIDLTRVYTENTKPEVCSEIINGCGYKYVPYIMSEDNGMYTYRYLLIKDSEYTYGKLVDIIIGFTFSLRETLAIMNNYMLDPNNPKYKAEFDELQNIRKAAKDYAKKHFNI